MRSYDVRERGREHLVDARQLIACQAPARAKSMVLCALYVHADGECAEVIREVRRVGTREELLRASRGKGCHPIPTPGQCAWP